MDGLEEISYKEGRGCRKCVCVVGGTTDGISRKDDSH